MDFDSPDVAKEFPGLAKVLSDGDEYDDREKSKKKKEKKDSKKDKDKGYAALNDSPDEDEGETKSPGKGMKIKAFKWTKKKDKDKEKTPPKAPEKERAKSLSSEVEKKVMREDLQPKQSTLHLAAAAEVVRKSVPVADTTGPPTQQQQQQQPRRPFDGQGYKHSPPGGLVTKSSKKAKQASVDPAAIAASSSTTSTAEKKGLNVFLNAPVPMLLKKKDSKEMEAKKEGHGLSAAKVKLKLKRGSKSSLDEVFGAESLPMTLPHLPEDPEIIAKEIKKHEAMLEQAHAQVKSGKKVSKKTEEQLWELQRNLTQLKRKLRAVNALSASYAPPPVVTASSTLSAPTKTSSSSSSESAEKVAGSKALSVQTVNPLPAPPTPPLEISKPEVESTVTVEETPLESIPEPAAASQIIFPESDSISSAISAITVDSPTEREPKVVPPTSSIHPLPQDEEAVLTPDSTETERRDTIQVKAEVHTSVSHENPTPEDIYEQEIQSFNGAEGGARAPLGKRENFEKGRRLLHVQETPDSAQSKSEEPPYTGGAESAETSDSGKQRRKTDDGDYVFLQPGSRSTKSQDDSASQDEPSGKITAPSIFDPFALAEFKTDEFIAAENEALIRFNQELQDEIVKEEEQIEELIRQIQEVNSERSPDESKSDLLTLDDDELVSLWQIVKFENDALNEQVLNLKTMVANSRLEEFRLETRVKYLQEKKHSGGDGGVLKREPESVVA